jgi:hypothetical protein
VKTHDAWGPSWLRRTTHTNPKTPAVIQQSNRHTRDSFDLFHAPLDTYLDGAGRDGDGDGGAVETVVGGEGAADGSGGSTRMGGGKKRLRREASKELPVGGCGCGAGAGGWPMGSRCSS